MQPHSDTRSFDRRSVELSCEIITNRCDAIQHAWATDLSLSGAWLEAPEAMCAGEELVICMRPPIGWALSEMMLFATVARSHAGLRATDPAPGLALRFLDMRLLERDTLARWLAPRSSRQPDLRLVRPRAAPSHHPFAGRMSC